MGAEESKAKPDPLATGPGLPGSVTGSSIIDKTAATAATAATFITGLATVGSSTVSQLIGRESKKKDNSLPGISKAKNPQNSGAITKTQFELYNIHMSLTNVLQYVSFSSPLLLIFFITLYSIIQNKFLSGLVFNMGIVIMSSIVYILKHILKNKQQSNANPFCNVLPSPFSVRAFDENTGPHFYDSPSFSSAVLSFSATYLIYPMILKNQQNIGLIVFSTSLVLINAVTESIYKCSGLFGIILGILIGIIFAIIYYSLLMTSNDTSKYLLFSDSISNNTQCSRVGNQNFKCSLYKNGVQINATGID